MRLVGPNKKFAAYTFKFLRKILLFQIGFYYLAIKIIRRKNGIHIFIAVDIMIIKLHKVVAEAIKYSLSILFIVYWRNLFYNFKLNELFDKIVGVNLCAAFGTKPVHQVGIFCNPLAYKLHHAVDSRNFARFG